jgi:ABC-type lipoprotein export system ATPase subunit
MKGFVDKMKLKELAEENIYFAKQDMELIAALQRGKLVKLAKCGGDDEKRQAETFQERFDELSEKHKNKPRKLLKSYRSLLDDIKDACKRRS